jgi:integrase
MQEKPNGPTRRTKVAKKGYTGVYYRDTPDGRRYEITYLDRAKVRRWETVDGNLDDAAQELARHKTSVKENKHVAPSDATFDQAADEWQTTPAYTGLAERTRERYDANLRIHLRPWFGNRKLQEIDGDAIAELVTKLTADGKAAWTVRNVLTTLSALYRWGSGRRKLAAFNPVKQLERHERPKVRKRKGRTLQPREIEALLVSATSDRYRVLLATAIFTGLRLQELLGLRWQDVDFDAGEIRVRCQLTRKRAELVELKSDAGVREVTLRSQLAQMLRHYKAASAYSLPSDYVFCTRFGDPLGWRNVQRRAMDAAYAAAVAAKRIPIGRPKPVMHDARHTFGSMLIREGEDVYSVSRQMGHANVSTTLNVYTGEYDRARDPSNRPDYGNALETTGSFRRLRGLHGLPKTAEISRSGK